VGKDQWFCRDLQLRGLVVVAVLGRGHMCGVSSLSDYGLLEL